MKEMSKCKYFCMFWLRIESSQRRASVLSWTSDTCSAISIIRIVFIIILRFIVNMKKAFQDREHLYLVMDLLQGGDLRFHFCKMRRFTEEQTSNESNLCEQNSSSHAFWSAWSTYTRIPSFTAISSLKIWCSIKRVGAYIYCSGYLRLTDLGIARIWRPDN